MKFAFAFVLCLSVCVGQKIESHLGLRTAATKGDLDGVRRLLTQNDVLVAIDAKDYGEQTPLMRACYGGHIAVVKELLDAGADINLAGPRGWTALISATAMAKTQAHVLVVKELLKRGAKVSGVAMAVAKQQNHDKVAKILEKAASKKLKRLVRLLLASGENDAEMVKKLLADGVDPNGQLENGWSPLMEASSKGHTEAVYALLLGGASLKITSGDSTAMSVAKEKKFFHIVEILQKERKLRKEARKAKKVKKIAEDLEKEL